MPHTPHHLCYAFGPFRIDTSTCVLTRSGDTISLTPKAAQILLILLANAGQLVEKDELLNEVWPDTFVEESNLSQNIFMLRRALGDERAGPRYIETVTRRGYRFVASVRVVDPAENQNGEALAPVAIEATQRPIVAVLPFINISGDQEIEYLADGVTENIINHLSRVSKLRVMSRSAVFRRMKDGDPWQIGADLGATAVLAGKINSRPSGIVISVEFVDASTGWQLWGESFDCQSRDILEIQDAITRQLLATLQLELTGDEEKCVTARYTENAEAYQAYLEGRYHWSRYTRKGIEKAIGHFRHAIDLDPNYALAYAGIVDCYLRLATNYLPPEDDLPHSTSQPLHDSHVTVHDTTEPDPKVKLRFEWDWKGAERELRRANELKTDYPSAHQWYAAYRTSQQLYEESFFAKGMKRQGKPVQAKSIRRTLPTQIASLALTPSEQVQVYCTVAREQIDAGNYEAACRVLQGWWVFGNWPKLDGLNQQCGADLLLTAGQLAGCVASTKQLPRGQKHGEELLNGSIALFEQLAFPRRAAEGRIELALCYYRQGLFDIGRSTLTRVLDDLSDENWELRSLALIRLASLERHAGRLKDALARLIEATSIVELSGPWATGRCHLELASTYKDLAISEGVASYFEEAKNYYFTALYEFEAVGHHRYVAAVENNMGFLLLNLGTHEESEKHLLRSQKLFDGLSDSVRGAQVNETLARLYIETKQYTRAQKVSERAVDILELTDGEALLAEAYTTNGVVAARLGQYSNAKKSLEAAHRVAERCGDYEAAGRALLILFEEMGDRLEQAEKVQVSKKFTALLAKSQQTAVQTRVENSIAKLAFRPKQN
jgi:DNA-binding winged helix-turn-helix (wHTH) protein/tetratricopeptide (TPR) repeat protein